MKSLVIVFLLLMTLVGASAQSLTLDDLISLTGLDHQQAKKYLTDEKKFIAQPIIDTFGTVISQFNKEDRPKTTEFIVKSAWTDERQQEHPYVHYDVRPKAYANVIINQLKSEGFRLSSHESDKLKTVSFYENDNFTVSIYTFHKKSLPASIEIHKVTSKTKFLASVDSTNYIYILDFGNTNHAPPRIIINKENYISPKCDQSLCYSANQKNYQEIKNFIEKIKSDSILDNDGNMVFAIYKTKTDSSVFVLNRAHSKIFLHDFVVFLKQWDADQRIFMEIEDIMHQLDF